MWCVAVLCALTILSTVTGSYLHHYNVSSVDVNSIHGHRDDEGHPYVYRRGGYNVQQHVRQQVVRRSGGPLFEMQDAESVRSLAAQLHNDLLVTQKMDHASLGSTPPLTVESHFQDEEKRVWCTAADVPLAQHPSGVFPRRRGSPIDSVVAVSWDVFPSTAPAAERNEIEALMNEVQQTTDGAARRALLKHIALWQLGRAYLQRPGSSHSVHSDASTNPYFTFFDRRRPIGKTFSAQIGTALSAACAVEETHVGAPVQFDVVYTYVQGDAPSHEAFVKKFASVFHSGKHRFRDWNELHFSTRSVFHRAMCGERESRCHGEATDGSRNQSSASYSIVRNIFIIVADRDQKPPWLRLPHKNIKLVTHAELFGPDDAHALPVFNSHAIESVVHRVPGLSRFFVYFNNDMMWGRQVSFFDYFRPLSSTRQLAREEACPAYAAEDDSKLHSPASSIRAHADYRVTILFEPVHYYENSENQNDYALVNRAANVVQERRTSATAQSCGGVSHAGEQHSSANGTDMPVDVAALFKMQFKLAKNPRRRSLTAERFRAFASNNRNYVFETLGVSGWPTHSFAHYPRLLDKRVMTDMLEVDFKDAARATRYHRTRRVTSLWTTMACLAYHLMHRDVVDWTLLAARATNDDSKSNATHFFTWPDKATSLFSREKARSLEAAGNLTVLDVLSPFWISATQRGPFGIKDMKFSRTYFDAVRAVRAALPWSGVIPPVRDDMHLCEVIIPSASSQERGKIITAPVGGKDAAGHLDNLLVQSQPSSELKDHAPQSSDDSTNKLGFAQDCQHTIASLLHNAKPGRFLRRDTPPTRSPVTASSISFEQWVTTDIEKLDHHVVKLDQKAGMYHFCMMATTTAVSRYTRELKEQTKLFVTVNDDFGPRLIPGVEERVQELLQEATGHLEKSNWEV